MDGGASFIFIGGKVVLAINQHAEYLFKCVDGTQFTYWGLWSSKRITDCFSVVREPKQEQAK